MCIWEVACVALQQDGFGENLRNTDLTQLVFLYFLPLTEISADGGLTHIVCVSKAGVVFA